MRTMDIGRRIYRWHASKSVNAAVMALYRRCLLLRAADDTRRSERASCLVLAPHPDDETLGCGATIMHKLAAGTRVHVAIATDGRNSHRSTRITPDELAAVRRREADAACDILGVRSDARSYLSYADGSLTSSESDLVRDILALIERFAPDEILAPSGIDGHPDHRALNAAARRALVIAAKPITLYEYPIWFWDLRSWVDRSAGPSAQVWQALYRPMAALVRLRPNVIATAPFLSRKRAAIAAYRSQTVNLTGEPGWPTFDERFLRHFLQSQEIFFAVEIRR